MTETSRTPFLAIAAAGLLAACDAAAPAPVAGDDAPRQRIGKSDWSPIGSCKDACGDKTNDGNCWCDDLCATYGDCCSDKATVCDGGGCTSDDQCGDDQYCAEIMCITTPCPPSTCVAKASEGMFCSASVPCSEGLSCTDSTCTAKTCHVGGCSGQLCTAQPGAISTCLWKEEYACYKKPGAACEAQPNGGCGWTMTGEAAQCMDQMQSGCSTHADCSADEYCQQIVCITTPCNNPCLPKVGAGGDCQEDAMCQDGLACQGGKCAAAGGACVGHCGGQADEGCWCDKWCAAYGDCCPGKSDDCN